MHLLALSTILSVASAHFVLQYPHSLGFDDAIEGTQPCGGFPVKFSSNDTNVPVDGFAVSMLSTHPQAEWRFLVTLSTAAPFNWTNILPIVDQTAIGQFCLPSLKVPDEFAGQKGLIQITQDAVDGMLYQCAAVNFVSGANTTVGPTCVNATGLTATVSNQNNFSPSASSSASGAASMTMSATSSPSATASGNAAPVAAQFPHVSELSLIALLGGVVQWAL